MQKWCPEPFDDLSGPVATVAGAVLEAQSAFTSASAEHEQPEGDRGRLFMSESGFMGPETMMAHLTKEERAQIYDLVEQDLNVEYEAREREMALAQATELENTRQAFDAALEAFSTRISAAKEQHCKEIAEAAARISLVLAEKIIRQKVETDPTVMLRGLETAIFKLEERRGVIVVANPEEAAWLEGMPEVLQKLGIQEVQPDRRIDKGGCLVRTESKEWDATLKGQISYLSDLVEEMVSTQEPPDLNTKDDTDVDPGLD